MELHLKGSNVLITGATRGIGLAAARAFLNEGCKVFLNGHHRERLEKCCRELEMDFPGQVVPCLGDVTTDDGITQAIDTITGATDHLDVAVMNLGNGKPEAKDPMQADEWRRFYEVNVLSAVSVLDRIRPLLVKGSNASIVLISSVVARERSSAPVGYAAAKGAILTLNSYLSGMWAKDGIRVNCVLPGNICFPGGRWEELLAEDAEGVHNYIKSNVPMNRFGKPEEIADAIVFLSSGRAGFITGAALNVDGGQQRSI